MTYLTTRQLADRLQFSHRYINEVLRPECLVDGRHYIRPFGRRKVLYLWENIEADMYADAVVDVPMANGGVCHG